MSADEFFEKHSIEEINKKTKISPISLRFIKNREFDKLPRVKFIGFVRLIEKRYKVDLSDLIKEYEEYFQNKEGKSNKKEVKKEKTENKKVDNSKESEKNYYLLIFFGVLVVLSGILFVRFFKTSNEKPKLTVSFEKNETFTQKNMEIEANNSEMNISNNMAKTDNIDEKNITKEYNITIIPKKRVWFRALNIDSNKTKEYLTSHKIVLKGNYYLKFGHGYITILYNDKNITPEPNQIVRILLKNGKYQFLKKPNEYEK